MGMIRELLIERLSRNIVGGIDDIRIVDGVISIKNNLSTNFLTIDTKELDDKGLEALIVIVEKLDLIVVPF